ncbi:hypothetical protein Bca52824_015556 [Brassica carinata]|uniref:Uncharacterized protein n=1 Tax=Brassica carinata TaxID=52824 RepID=A0A8X8B5H5_BRACI|nr:hypothetical protein Bca52824_015556 [Brassica carinata]
MRKPDSLTNVLLILSKNTKYQGQDKLPLAGEGNPVLAKEASALTHWDSLYKENLEARLAVLKRLVGEWKEHSVKISSSSSNALILNRTMKSFMQNMIVIDFKEP